MNIGIPEKYKDLWKIEDLDWVKNRKAMWKELAKASFFDATPKQISEYRRYFLTGEKRKLGTVCRDYKFLCTPMTTSKQMIDILFDEEMFHKTEMQGILSGYYQGTLKAWGVGWYSEHAKLFASTFYKGTYRTWTRQYRGKELVLTPDAGYLFDSTVHWLGKLLSGKVSYVPQLEAIEYMMNVINPENKPKYSHPDTINLDELFNIAGKAISNESLTQRTQDVAKQVLTYESVARDFWTQTVEPIETSDIVVKVDRKYLSTFKRKTRGGHDGRFCVLADLDGMSNPSGFSHEAVIDDTKSMYGYVRMKSSSGTMSHVSSMIVEEAKTIEYFAIHRTPDCCKLYAFNHEGEKLELIIALDAKHRREIKPEYEKWKSSISPKIRKYYPDFGSLTFEEMFFKS